jgi:hypothetical protein
MLNLGRTPREEVWNRHGLNYLYLIRPAIWSKYSERAREASTIASLKPHSEPRRDTKSSSVRSMGKRLNAMDRRSLYLKWDRRALAVIQFTRG